MFFQWDMLIILNVIKILFVFLRIMDVMLLKLIINNIIIYYSNIFFLKYYFFKKSLFKINIQKNIYNNDKRK